MIIIPDVHGRTFWRKPVEECLAKEHILFLGDYLDPYGYEGISAQDSTSHFEEIIALKKEHPDDVTLLLGNHDLHYVDYGLLGGRYDYVLGEKNKKLITDNASLFAISHIAVIDDKKFLFTHAGLRKGWVKNHREIFGDMGTTEVALALNMMWQETVHRPVLFSILEDVPFSRLGNSPYGSPVWSDVDDMDIDQADFPGWYQIFGHTQQVSDPVIGKYCACLDCRRAFRLTDTGDIVEYD